MPLLVLLPLLVALACAQNDGKNQDYYTDTLAPEEHILPQNTGYMPGGWYPLEPEANHPALKFALTNAEKYLAEEGYCGNFKLIDILSASAQTVAGYNYNFQVTVESGYEIFTCGLYVFESIRNLPRYSMSGNPECTSEWQEITCKNECELQLLSNSGSVCEESHRNACRQTDIQAGALHCCVDGSLAEINS